MKAVQIHRYGGPEELIYEDASTPDIQPDDVLIRVKATSINPVDWKVREGARKDPNRRFPIILGWDVSGIIEKVGGEVKDFKVGDEVYGRPDTTRNGTYAEYVAVRAAEIALKPISLNHNGAAAIPLAGLTAWQGIFDHGKLQAGQKILIHGASGGVGTLAVQLARWRGAYVIGTASAENADFLRELGADEVIDYTSERFEDKLHDIDVVFDTIGGDVQTNSLQVLKPGGILVSTVGIKDEKAVKDKGLQGVAYMARSLPDQLRQMAQLIDEGKLKPIISRTLPLSGAAEAQKESEQGHTKGKIVLTVG
jgi:NADPH:quinone reductase-like Zn-dependent oxidoreductase